MNVTFRQLRVFAEVARLGSMIRAAESLHLTPPAISMHVRELEAQVGLALFDRTGRTVELSTAGEYFLVHANRLLANLKDADNAMARFKKLENGLLTIGIVSTAQYFIPALLARFHEEHKGVEVRLRVAGNREQLVALMQSADVDLAVMGRPPRELATRSEAFAAHPHVFIAPIGHSLLKRGKIPVSALAEQPFIVREHGSGTRAALEGFLADHHVKVHVTMEMAANETIKQAVMAGLGLSFVSLHTCGLELRSGLLHILEIDQAPVMRMWNVVHLQAKILSPSAQAFRYFLLEHGEAHLLAHDAPLLDQDRALRA
jgi:LysR family transcriptional regulator, low CO2-responsive transcriptional regulator